MILIYVFGCDAGGDNIVEKQFGWSVLSRSVYENTRSGCSFI